jgi:hypothetical protein
MNDHVSGGAGAIDAPPECGASAILTAGGPTRVPFQLCCAFAVIGAAGPDPAPFVCGALEPDPTTALLASDRGSAMAGVGERLDSDRTAVAEFLGPHRAPAVVRAAES